MKIVCDACQAKYSISDDKVQGKVFKIRCKKCSNIIVVRGGAGAAEPAPAPQQEKDTRVYDYGYDGGGEHAPAGDEAVWHVVINQDQVGPMTAVEVHQRFASGEIDNETYIWREGFADWLPLTQVDTFAGLVASGSTTAAVGHGGGGADAVAAMFGGGGGDEGGTMRSDPGDLFAAASSSGAQHHRGEDDGDLFGKKPAAAAAAPSQTAAQQAQNAKLRGERNENSVLFSLNNLAQLASDRPAPAAAHASSNQQGAATGAAGGEGSGLIDIRSMANAYLGGGGAGAAKPASAGVGSIDDLPVFGGGGFSEPAVIVPMSHRQSNNKVMYALIGSIAALVVAAVIVVVVVVKGGNNKDQAASADQAAKVALADKEKAPDKAPDTADKVAAPDKASGSDTANPDKVAAPDTAGSGSAAEKTPDKAAPAPDKAATPDKAPAPAPAHPAPAHKAGMSPPPSHDATVAHAPPAPKAPKEPKEAPAPKGDAGGCDEVSCVLNNYEGACCTKFKKGGNKAPSAGVGAAAPSSGGSGLPDSLDRQMISDGVGKVKAKVMACGDKSPKKGQLKVSVKVDGSGHVSSVTVKTSLDPALDNCVSAQMSKATFAKTVSGGSFGYPFVF